MRKSMWIALVACLVLALLVAGQSCAQTGKKVAPADLYKGKSITLVTPANPGTSSDLAARLMAEALKKYLESTIVIDTKNEVGAIQGGNYMYSMKTDGMYIGAYELAGMAANQVFESPGVTYDVSKFLYLYGTLVEPQVFNVTPNGPYQTVAALKAAKNLKFGTVSPRGNWSLATHVVAAILDLDVKIVTGMQTGPIQLALTSGELNGTAWGAGQSARQAKSGQTKPLFVVAGERHPSLPDVPAITELVDVKGDKLELLKMARSFDSVQIGMMPPGTPQDIVDFLRDACNKAIKEPTTVQKLKEIAGYEGAKSITASEVTEVAQTIVNRGNEYKKAMSALIDKYKP